MYIFFEKILRIVAFITNKAILSPNKFSFSILSPKTNKNTKKKLISIQFYSDLIKNNFFIKFEKFLN